MVDCFINCYLQLLFVIVLDSFFIIIFFSPKWMFSFISDCFFDVSKQILKFLSSFPSNCESDWRPSDVLGDDVIGLHADFHGLLE